MALVLVWGATSTAWATDGHASGGASAAHALTAPTASQADAPRGGGERRNVFRRLGTRVRGWYNSRTPRTQRVLRWGTAGAIAYIGMRASEGVRADRRFMRARQATAAGGVLLGAGALGRAYDAVAFGGAFDPAHLTTYGAGAVLAGGVLTASTIGTGAIGRWAKLPRARRFLRRHAKALAVAGVAGAVIGTGVAVGVPAIIDRVQSNTVDQRVTDAVAAHENEIAGKVAEAEANKAAAQADRDAAAKELAAAKAQSGAQLSAAAVDAAQEESPTESTATAPGSYQLGPGRRVINKPSNLQPWQVYPDGDKLLGRYAPMLVIYSVDSATGNEVAQRVMIPLSEGGKMPRIATLTLAGGQTFRVGTSWVANDQPIAEIRVHTANLPATSVVFGNE